MGNRNHYAILAAASLTIEGARQPAPPTASTDRRAQEQDAPLVWFRDVLGRWRFRAPRSA